jgi:hypothetical protein
MDLIHNPKNNNSKALLYTCKQIKPHKRFLLSVTKRWLWCIQHSILSQIKMLHFRSSRCSQTTTVRVSYNHMHIYNKEVKYLSVAWLPYYYLYLYKSWMGLLQLGTVTNLIRWFQLLFLSHFPDFQLFSTHNSRPAISSSSPLEHLFVTFTLDPFGINSRK